MKNGDPLLEEMKKIQQNEHENKCRIQHIRNVLKDPVRMKQFLDNTGSHQLANELVEMFIMDNNMDDMIFTFVNMIDLGQMSTTGDPLLDEMKKIQQNEHENKCRIQHIRRVLNDPGRFIQLLDITGSHQLANELVEMFIMDYPWPYRIDLAVLPVVRASELRSGNIRYFFMDSSPRGQAIVFICADGLDREADRWESILGQLGIEQDVYRKAKCSQIRDVLLGVSGQPFDADALFVMFIGGRYDEKIDGYGGNEMWITDIVDIFSDTN
ncbi:unnamed protein product, partial [Oppiella nova]